MNDRHREETASKPKGRYHHGDLREALIAASYTLVSERGAENFLLSDACRLAGVSTAAPYKHFKDRDEILEEVAARAFDALGERSMAAVAAQGEGTLDGIIAMGEAYVQFAIDEERLFRLMFGQHPIVKSADHVQDDGQRCFTGVIQQVARYCEAQKLPGDPRAIAIRLWTFVHGAASLLIDKDYAVVAPDLDVMAMIRATTPLMLAPGK
jgi:AcrR family transcriptional regulator